MPNAANLDLQPSPACLDLIRRSEGLNLTAYPDEGAYSIGYGHRNVPEGTVWTLAYAETALTDDTNQVGDEIKQLVDVPLTQGQFDALVDFCFNLGQGSLAASTLLQELNIGRYDAAAEQLLCWDHAGVREYAGLKARREAEFHLWHGAAA